jgi:DNA-binding NtrC family response regulator
MSKVLLVDDDESAVSSLARALSATIRKLSVSIATTAGDALEIAEKEHPGVAVIDLCLEPQLGVESGFQLLQQLQQRYQALRIIVLTGHSDSTYGIRAMQLGASNFMVKPADISHLSALIEEGFKQHELLEQLHHHEAGEQVRVLEEELVGNSHVVQALREQIGFFASTSQPVLIEGETGVGKSLCARLIHRLSKRKHGRFVRYQPGLSRSDVLASELFGHEKGAFTGAEQSRDGLILRAHNGTFFLDEIDGLPMETQTGLLGVLQEKQFRRVGADQETQVDLRFLSATNADVDLLVEKGELRKDFFHRIAHARVRIPPLRERREDIPCLAQAMIHRLQEVEEFPYLELSDGVCDRLIEHDWPGNVRELEGVVEGACSHAHYCSRSEILPEDIQIHGTSQKKSNASQGHSLRELVTAFKQEKVQEALHQNDNNQVKAAKALGIDRTTLRRILQDS